MKNYLLKKGVVIIEPIDPGLKESPILRPDVSQKKEYHYEDFKDHPFQGKVIQAGYIEPGLFGYEKTGVAIELEKGDIVCLERELNPSYDVVNFDGEVYGRVNANNIFAIVKPVIDKKKLN